MSGQPSGPGVTTRAAASDSHRMADMPFYASQESDGDHRKRKASFVADPIYQKLLPAATRQRSRLHAMGR